DLIQIALGGGNEFALIVGRIKSVNLVMWTYGQTSAFTDFGLQSSGKLIPAEAGPVVIDVVNRGFVFRLISRAEVVKSVLGRSYVCFPYQIQITQHIYRM